MKIKIGPYINWWGPYQIVGLLKHLGFDEDKLHDFTTKLLDKVPLFSTVCEWVHSKRKRNVKIKIDDYDVWNLDRTLSFIIVPALQKFKETERMGIPLVQNEDVPDNLKTSENFEESYSIDKWNYVLDEMIWAFTQIRDDGEYNIPIEKWDEFFDRVNNGVRLFGKYFRALWD